MSNIKKVFEAMSAVTVGELAQLPPNLQEAFLVLARTAPVTDSLIVPGTMLSQTEYDLCLQGKKINAIKAHRERTGADLKTAKDFIESEITRLQNKGFRCGNVANSFTR